MKKINSESQIDGMTTSFELFNSILENSGYNLNQYVKGDMLAITDDVQEEYVNTLKEFMDIAADEVKNIEDKEAFWSIFEKLDDYKDNNRFIAWLKKYIEAANRLFEDAAFLRDIEDTAFERMTDYCFQNLILRDIGKKRIANEWDLKQMTILRKILFTFIEMVVTDNFSKENTFANMQKLFGISGKQCEHWWNIVNQNEEKLWRIMLMKQYSRLENKIDIILENLEEKERREDYL